MLLVGVASTEERSLWSLGMLLVLVLSSRSGDGEHGGRGRAGLAPLGRRRPGHGGRTGPSEDSRDCNRGREQKEGYKKVGLSTLALLFSRSRGKTRGRILQTTDPE